MVSILNKPIEQISPQDYYSLLKELNMKPGVVDLESLDV
jgi:hypothetical protein